MLPSVMYPVTLKENVINAVAVAKSVASPRSCSVPCSGASGALNKDTDFSTPTILQIKPVANAGGRDSSRRYSLRLPMTSPVIPSVNSYNSYMSYTIFPRALADVFLSVRKYVTFNCSIQYTFTVFTRSFQTIIVDFMADSHLCTLFPVYGFYWKHCL